MFIYTKLGVWAWSAPWNPLGRLKQAAIEVPSCRQLPYLSDRAMRLLPRSPKGERSRDEGGRGQRDDRFRERREGADVSYLRWKWSPAVPLISVNLLY